MDRLYYELDTAASASAAGDQQPQTMLIAAISSSLVIVVQSLSHFIGSHAMLALDLGGYGRADLQGCEVEPLRHLN